MSQPIHAGTARRALIFGSSSIMNEVVRTATRIAPSDATALITGETGTGKEVMARVLHENSARASKAFVPMNCAAIPETLLESELFGHARGAFTGAVTARRGRLSMAEGGTLFLDEIGELPLSLQVKLLRVLQERVYEPVGSNESISTNFRLVVATNRDLVAEVEAGRFRRDLYYRLVVCPIELPPLRERSGDVLELFMHFWKERGEVRAIEPAVIDALERYRWPGNVRELENLVERISVLAEGPVITARDLPWQLQRGPLPALSPDGAPTLSDLTLSPMTFKVPLFGLPSAVPLPRSSPPPEPLSQPASWAPRSTIPPAPLSPPVPAAASAVDWAGAPTPPPPPSAPAAFPVDLPTLLRRLEDEYIDAALSRSQGNKKAAADLLGLQRTTLVEKLRRRLRDVDQPAGSPAPG